MSQTSQPVSGSLEAKIIRACTRHSGTCPLDCKYRKVEDLGQIASFVSQQSPAARPSFIDRLKTIYRRIA